MFIYVGHQISSATSLISLKLLNIATRQHKNATKNLYKSF